MPTIALECLSPEEYGIVKPFYKDFSIYPCCLQAILEQRSLGTVFTDSRDNPTFCLVCSPLSLSNLNAQAYVAGKFDESILEKIASFLKPGPKVSLVAPLHWKYVPIFEKAGFQVIERVQLKRDAPSFDLSSWKKALPSSYSIVEMDGTNFSQCQWRPFVLSCYGDKERFFKAGAGFCILDRGKVISESYGLFVANGQVEMGVITNPEYRGQNLGTIGSAIMLDYCYKNHLEPYWNCDVQNFASATIAKKLGFEEDARYLLLKRVINENLL